MLSMGWDSWLNQLLFKYGIIWYNLVIWVYILLGIYVVVGIVRVLLKKTKIKKYFSIWKLGLSIFFLVLALGSQYIVYKEIPLKFDNSIMSFYWVSSGMDLLGEIDPKNDGKTLVDVLNDYKVKRVFDEFESPYQVTDDMYRFSIMNGRGLNNNYHFIITPEKTIIYWSGDKSMYYELVDHDGQFYNKVGRYLDQLEIIVH